MQKTMPVFSPDSFFRAGGFFARALVLLVSVSFMFSCAPRKPDPVITPEPVIPEAPFGPAESMDEFLERRLNEQYSSLDAVFDIPENPLDESYVLISHERPVLTLAQEATSFAGNEQYFAAGLGSRGFRVWSDWPCSGAVLPEAEPVQKLWWDGYSPYICIRGLSPERAVIYDLRDCSKAGEITSEGPLEKVAVSLQGNHVSLVDKGNRLWTGSLKGDFEHVATLRYEPLDMAFTPGEGVLMVADASGWLVLWTLPDYELLDQVQIPGGPFQRARFEGPRLVLEGWENPDLLTVWDIPGARELDGDAGRGRFVLDNRVLYYVPAEKQYIKKVLMQDRDFRVWKDKENLTIRVRDLDGEDRYYCARSGSFLQDGAAPGGMEPVEVDAHGGFTWKGAEYRLADPVMVKEDWVLLARHIPGSGYYLWWTGNMDNLNSREFQGQLPRRDSIRDEIPPDWEEVK